MKSIPKQNLELKNYLTFADIHNPLSALVIEKQKAQVKIFLMSLMNVK